MKTDDTFTAYITKYALTQGILEVEVRTTHSPQLVVDCLNAYMSGFHGEGNEWHRTREGAIRRAIEMRDKKLASLEKQIKSLTEMTFV